MALEMKYFVLKPHGNGAHASASRSAMAEYARAIEPHDPSMSKELCEWVDREWVALKNPPAEEK